MAAAADNGDFVTQVYRDLLGRLPGAGELAVLVDLLDRGSPRGDIALLVVTSNEHRTNFVQGLYGALLGRTASPGENSALITALAGGATDEEVIAIVAGSAEYFDLHGGGHALFLSALFEEILGRPIDADELAVFLRFLEGGGSRQDVARALLRSVEYRTRLIERYSWSYLLRRPSAAEMSAFLALFAGGATDEEIVASIIGSNEYFEKVAPTLADLCKEKGWRKFASPEFKNQGECLKALGRKD